MCYRLLILLSAFFIIAAPLNSKPLKGRVSNLGEPGWIGIDYCPGNKRVVKVYLNTPAYEAGLLPHDKICSHSDNDIKGPAGTTVTLLVYRKGIGQFLLAVDRMPVRLVDKTKFIK